MDHILTENQIRHTIRKYTEEDSYCGGWVDFGDLTKKKHMIDDRFIIQWEQIVELKCE